jgi:epoxyqueuosine reductase QueG
VNEQFGSAFRLGAVLTDAPLSADEPITQSRCGSCHTCVDVCPAGAPLGPLWQQKMEREQFFNFAACKETAYRLTRERIVEPNDTIAHCGICLANCRFTKRWVKNAGKI